MLSDKGLKTKDPPSVHILVDRGRAGSIEDEIGWISQQINKRYHRLAADVEGAIPPKSYGSGIARRLAT
ncbi:hypothetical protein C0V72_14435 [Porphyrobacter sp. TH134]|nr:hypothetical protein C0V72_14435 [Porphyrobacter sp. TH134]